MPRQILKAAQTGTSKGRLQIQVTTEQFQPIKDAKVSISYSGDPQSTVEQITTNISGQTDEIELNAPPIEYSLNEENVEQPYADYTINVIAEGFEPINISGTEILADTTALQEVTMQPVAANAQPSNIVIPAHTLYGNYPPKIAETEIKPVGESGEIVLSQVVIPEFVIVHDGAPTDSTAKNYWVRYRDYIKNVASSEIYATWPENTITANVLAIMSFTLNRVYTEWYKNQGFNFSITSSTAFDHKWMYGRNIYNNISRIVDSIFNNYLSRPNVKQPIFTQYCDGKKVQCPNWMTQWGSKTLGDQNYPAIQILRYYYGNELYINNAEQISGVPSSWPGSNLTIGSRGEKVKQIQEQLSRISQSYPAIPRIAADGVFGEHTQAAVRAFQQTFGLPATGIIDFATWYKISHIYVAVTRMAEVR